jgi:tetratricopeptide (TPR) repeat protein
MKRISSGCVRLLVFWGFLFASGYLCESDAERCDTPVAQIVSVQGTVEVKSAGNTQWQPVTLNETFCQGDTIRVLEKSRAGVTLQNRSFLRINENTTIVLEGVLQERTSLIDLLKGAAHFLSREPKSLKVKTQYAIFGVRGTEFYTRVDDSQSFLSVFEGSVFAENAFGSLMLTDGQAAVAQADKAPVMRVVAKPRDAVQWALYYPPVMYGISPEVIELNPEEIGDPLILVQRAALLLAVGQVEAALVDLDRALSIDPNNGNALALQSIVAIVQNDKDKALELARKSSEAAPQSATSWIAFSYASQGRFNLEDARDHLYEAVRVEPENALAWARLSELEASFGRLDNSLKAAKTAKSLAPNLSLTQTVLGFAYLANVKIKESQAAFKKAIELDQASPLARLGLGLAKIRSGKLTEGGREIETAASLDPNNALIRSYLGKVYFEQKRMGWDQRIPGLDQREFDIAKELDPNDPTAYFYDAIAKQTTNRPVEALKNYEKAIELNDNRAVFRSKLKLDSDLAARSAAVGRIYNELGFGQRGLFEGYNSVNTDPTDFSGHRFLADTYSVLPRHEIARVSELLQSQLLQPINITPIQPGLAESNLFLIGSQGPTQTSFNEFNNPLFTRNRAALQLNGLVGENSTWAGEGIVSGIYNKLSLSAGYNHFETDGWRTNADKKDDIAYVFAQYQLANKTSFQAEYRHREIDQGQLDLLFDPNISPEFRREREVDSFRLGFSHAFSPQNDVIVSFINQGVTIDQSQISGTPLNNTDFKEKRDGYLVELQHLFKRNKFNIVSGGGYLNQDFKQNVIVDVLPIPLPPPFPGFPPIVIDPPPQTIPQEDGNIRRANLYAYSQIEVLDSLSITAGLSADFLKIANQLDSNQLNPKFGITYNLFPETKLRGAVFRERGIRLDFNQTIEPTQVAGFNQFYDDINGTDSWRYGAAVDHKFSSSFFGGLEYSQRDLDVPRLADPGLRAQFFDWHEQFGRAYLYKTIGQWFALRAEYLYERFDREAEPLRRGIVDVTTHRVPIGFNFFHPTGLSAGIKGTYVNQSGKFQKRDSDDEFSDGDNFWIFDMSISYRIPKRFGFISIGAQNIFNKQFKYQDTDPANPSIIPGRFVFSRLTLSF